MTHYQSPVLHTPPDLPWVEWRFPWFVFRRQKDLWVLRAPSCPISRSSSWLSLTSFYRSSSGDYTTRTTSTESSWYRFWGSLLWSFTSVDRIFTSLNMVVLTGPPDSLREVFRRYVTDTPYLKPHPSRRRGVLRTVRFRNTSGHQSGLPTVYSKTGSRPEECLLYLSRSSYDSVPTSTFPLN